jgi:pimeloyl-ACP methyl ester carboxylesterase
LIIGDKSMKSRYWGLFAVLLLVVPFLPACKPGTIKAPANIKPIVFVHGGAGSGSQFESQSMRFTTNGYPANYIFAYEYDSTLGLTPAFPIDKTVAGLDTFIDSVLKDTGADKVDLMGHSLGTMVSQTYLRGSQAHAAKVAHYVNIDGQGGPDLPGGVPTLALTSGRRPPLFPPADKIVGATNINFPNVTHVECATCAQAFVEMFKFITGQAPTTDQILPEPSGKVQLAGRVVIFPQNIGINEADSTLQVWEVDGKTGARTTSQPLATYPMGGATGAWGPFDGKVGKNYELCLVRAAFTTHEYFEPTIRSDYFIRLNTEIPGKGLSSHMDTSDRQSDMYIFRNREFWGDQGADNDALTINGINIITPAICPIDKLVNAIFAYDAGADGKTDLSAPIAYFSSAIPVFITGADIYIPAANPPTGIIALVLTPRGGGGKTQAINVPNWPSTKDRIIVQFSDFFQAK